MLPCWRSLLRRPGVAGEASPAPTKSSTSVVGSTERALLPAAAAAVQALAVISPCGVLSSDACCLSPEAAVASDLQRILLAEGFEGLEYLESVTIVVELAELLNDFVDGFVEG